MLAAIIILSVVLGGFIGYQLYQNKVIKEKIDLSEENTYEYVNRLNSERKSNDDRIMDYIYKILSKHFELVNNFNEHKKSETEILAKLAELEATVKQPAMKSGPLKENTCTGENAFNNMIEILYKTDTKITKQKVYDLIQELDLIKKHLKIKIVEVEKHKKIVKS